MGGRCFLGISPMKLHTFETFGSNKGFWVCWIHCRVFARILCVAARRKDPSGGRGGGGLGNAWFNYIKSIKFHKLLKSPQNEMILFAQFTPQSTLDCGSFFPLHLTCAMVVCTHVMCLMSSITCHATHTQMHMSGLVLDGAHVMLRLSRLAFLCLITRFP